MIESVCIGEHEKEIDPTLALNIQKCSDAYVCKECGGKVTKIEPQIIDEIVRPFSALSPVRFKLVGCSKESIDSAIMAYKGLQ